MKKSLPQLLCPFLRPALLLGLLAAPVRAHSPQEAPPPAVEKALAQSGTNRMALEAAWKNVPAAQRPGLQFLLENMPENDLKTLDAAYLLADIALAYEAAEHAPWAKAIPPEIFLNDILPYANIQETREDWRRSLREKCLPLIADCKTPGEAAQRLNEKLYGLVNVKYSTKRKKADQSPSESMATGLASCTGLSILLVDACRSVGVPARLTGIPTWIDNRGNHTWVEIWDGRWHFTGAAEPDKNGLDHSWFEKDASLAVKNSRQHAIYAVSYAKTGVTFPPAWGPHAEENVNAENVTDNYAKAQEPTGKARLMVRVVDHPGGNRIAASVHLTDPTDASVKMDGTSKGERSDANDMLTFEVVPGRSYALQVAFGKQTVTQKIEVPKGDSTTVTINLGDTAAAPEIKPLKRADEAKLRKAMTDFFTASPEKQSAWKFDRGLETLLRENEPAVRRTAWEAYRDAPIHADARKDFDTNQVRFQNFLSPYVVRSVGVKPAKGWPLFIAMHGGGGAPKALNDSQWKEMQRHYHDHAENGGYLYLALRAPNDTWNGFYDDYVYPLIDNLIRQFTLFGDVDPDKVFIMGYSHGGYGAFAIGPKIPDHFAAIHASAGAPTDGETAAKTLRNTQFTFMVGEKDLAYGRLPRDQAFDAKIQKLRGDRTDIFPVVFEYKAGFEHSNLPDREKIKDMYPAVRNPVPAELTWEMTDTVVKHFFWLDVEKPAKKAELDATCRDNHVTVSGTNVARATILLDSRLVNFSKPVVIEAGGKVEKQTLKPSLLTLGQMLLERGDPGMAFTAKVDVKL